MITLKFVSGICFWSFGLQGFVVKLLAKQQYSQGWLQTGSAMDGLKT